MGVNDQGSIPDAVTGRRDFFSGQQGCRPAHTSWSRVALDKLEISLV
jgi:hypothetical protein